MAGYTNIGSSEILDFPLKARPVVKLSGNTEDDKNIWVEKIHKEVFNHDARPIEWAQKLSEHLQSNHQLWQLDLAVLNVASGTPIQGAFGPACQEELMIVSETECEA